MFVPITEDDVPRVVELMNRAYRGSGAAAGWTSEADFLSGDRTSSDLLRRDLLAKPEACFLKWVAPSGEMLGCVYLAPEADGAWYLGSLAADPGQQGSGLGSEMLAAAEQWVRQRGGTRVRMTVVNVRDPLIAWYCRRGYRLTGATEPFPYDDNRFGTPLRDDLCFVVLEKVLGEPAERR